MYDHRLSIFVGKINNYSAIIHFYITLNDNGDKR